MVLAVLKDQDMDPDNPGALPIRVPMTPQDVKYMGDALVNGDDHDEDDIRTSIMFLLSELP